MDSFTCEGCGNEFREEDGRPYKYEGSIWLCQDCEDEWLEDDDE